MQALVAPHVLPLVHEISQERQAALPAVLKLITISVFLPEDLSFYIGGLRLTLTRLILLLLAPVVVMQFGRKIAEGRYRFVLSDLLVPMTGVWMIAGPSTLVGLTDALNHGGPTALEFCIGYFVTRTMLSKRGQALSFINLLGIVIAIVALTAPVEMLTHRPLVHNLAATLTGYGKVWDLDNERLGLARAMSTFEHPILFGIACAIALLFAVSLPIRLRSFIIPACSLGALLALSSAPLQSIVIGFCLLAYNRTTLGITYRWGALIALGASVLMMFFMVLDAPFGFIFRHFTFDDTSAYWRLWTWNVAGDALAQSPWFGLGFVYPEEFEIPRTVDSVWLNQALTFGIPGALLIGFSFLGAVSLSTNGRKAELTAAESKLGTVLGILIFLIIFLGFTVDFYGVLWVLVPLVIGVRAHLGELGRISSTAHLRRIVM